MQQTVLYHQIVVKVLLSSPIQVLKTWACHRNFYVTEQGACVVPSC